MSKDGYFNWMKGKGLVGVIENTSGENKTGAVSDYLFDSEENAVNFQLLLKLKSRNQNLITGKWCVPVNQDAQYLLKAIYREKSRGTEQAPKIKEQQNLIAECEDKINKFDNEISAKKQKPMARGEWQAENQEESRIEKVAQMLRNEAGSDGWWFHNACSAIDLMMSVYIAKNFQMLSDEERSKLQTAQKLILQTDQEGRFIGGLKSDANFVQHLKESYNSESDKKTRVNLVREDVNLLLNGGERLIIDAETQVLNTIVPTSTTAAKDKFKQPRFFPDAQGRSESDILVVQAGGMNRHSSMRVLKKEADKNVTGGYRYFYTKADGGAGIEDVNHSNHSGTGIYTTEVKPFFKLTPLANGKLVIAKDNKGNPTPLSREERSQLEKDPKKYHDAMQATLFALLDSERQVLFYDAPKLAVDNGEAKSKDAFEWNFQNNTIKGLRGEVVPEKCKRTRYQKSGNCTVYSTMLLLTDLVGEELGYDMMQEFKTYTHDNTLQTLGGTKKELSELERQLQEKDKQTIGISGTKGNPPKLAIEFSSEEFADNFARMFQNINMTKEQDTKTLKWKQSIEPSAGIGQTGIYVASHGELSISFKDNKQRDIFTKLFGISADHAILPEVGVKGNNAVYFKDSFLNNKVLPKFDPSVFIGMGENDKKINAISGNKGNPPKLTIEFSSEEFADNFAGMFQNIKMTKEQDTKTGKWRQSIEPSAGIGQTGIYVASHGELSISFKDNKQRDMFTKLFGISADHAILPEVGVKGNNAVYFKDSALSPEGKAHSFSDKIQQEQAQKKAQGK